MTMQSSLGFRTESFSSSGERNAVQVIAYETFVLENSDILEYLLEHYLTTEALRWECIKALRYLDSFPKKQYRATCRQISIIRKILQEVSCKTGAEVRYVLWLTSKEAATDPNWYGKYMADPNDFDVYETSPIILADLDRDGRLYGYARRPYPLAERLEELKDQRKNILAELVYTDLPPQQEEKLTELYLHTDNEIDRISALLKEASSKAKK